MVMVVLQLAGFKDYFIVMGNLQFANITLLLIYVEMDMFNILKSVMTTILSMVMVVMKIAPFKVAMFVQGNLQNAIKMPQLICNCMAI
jgi:hypothetical protein